MTEDTLIRLLRAQLLKVQIALSHHIYSDGKKGELERLGHDINNCLAIVDAELKHIKRG